MYTWYFDLTYATTLTVPIADLVPLYRNKKQLVVLIPAAAPLMFCEAKQIPELDLFHTRILDRGLIPLSNSQ